MQLTFLALHYLKALNLYFAFQNRALRAICEDKNKAVNEFGDDVANSLFDRLADLRAATSISDLLAGNPTIVENGDDALLRIDILNNHSLILSSNHITQPKDKTGKLQWKEITRLKILKINCHHGSSERFSA